MTAPPPRRPWRKKKRTWAAVLSIASPVAYLASLGPMSYANARGWVSDEAAVYYAFPYGYSVGAVAAYEEWWAELGDRHAASD